MIHPVVLVSFVAACAASVARYGTLSLVAVTCAAFAPVLLSGISRSRYPAVRTAFLLAVAAAFWLLISHRAVQEDAAYAAGFAHTHKATGTFEGKIDEFPNYRFSDSQYVVSLGPTGARVLISLPPYQKFPYLQVVTVTGSLQDVREQDREWWPYYRKLGVQYTMFAPAITASQEVYAASRFERLRYALFEFKQQLREMSVERFSSHASALVLGMLLGEKEELSKDEKSMFNAASLSHILVVSGYNISLIITLIFALTKPVPRPLRTALAWVTIFLFVSLVGYDASVVRAALMGSIITLAKISHRPSSALNVLFAVATCMLACNPYAILDAGFHLSFVATYSLLIMPDLKKIPEFVITTVWVFLFVSPSILYLSGTISLAGILSNIAVTLILPIFMALSGLSLLLSLVRLNLLLDVALVDLMSRYIFAVARGAQRIPAGQYEMPSHILVTAYALACGAITYAMNRHSTAEFIEMRYQKFVPQRPS